MCVARFDGYPYEDLLARAYNLRIIQIADHPEDCVYPWCKHCIRPDFARDTVYPSHWYHWTGPQKDIPLHWSEQEHDQLLNSPAEYMDAMTTAFHIMYTFIDRTCQLRQSVRTPIDILKQQVWLKLHDHVHEQVWQSLLSYLYILYYSLDQSLFRNLPSLEGMDPMYVPTMAIRHNDHTINPMLLRRFTILRSLTKTSAMAVYDQKQSRVVSFESIIRRLFCPTAITESIGTNIMRHLRGVYMVHNVHAPVTHLYPPFRRDSSSLPFFAVLIDILMLSFFLRIFSIIIHQIMFTQSSLWQIY